MRKFKNGMLILLLLTCIAGLIVSLFKLSQSINTRANAVELSKIESKLSGKNIAFIGDSLTANNGTKKYIDIIREETGANCFNFGVNTSTIALSKDSKVKSFVERYTDIINEYPKDYFNIIVIFGGVNDFASDIKIGDFSTDRHTFMGSMGELVYNMQSQYPKSKIVLMTPLVSTYGSYKFDYSKNGAGALLEDYRKAIRDIADRYGCIVYDTNQYSGLNPNNSYMFEKYYSGNGDGVHPNEDGHKRIAIPLINLLNDLF